MFLDKMIKELDKIYKVKPETYFIGSCAIIGFLLGYFYN